MDLNIVSDPDELYGWTTNVVLSFLSKYNSFNIKIIKYVRRI